MEKRVDRSILFFAFVILLSLAGFFNTYIKFLPDFGKFPLIIHIHFIAFVSWLILLIIQPILIRRNAISLHRKIGKLSFIIAPILVITIIILEKNQIQREIIVSENKAATTAFIGLIDIISFSAYYIIAMINSKNLRWHVAFLIAATLVILNPGLSRLLNQIKPGIGLVAAVYLPFIVSIFMLFFEKIKYKNPILKNPYFFYLCSWTFIILLFIIIPNKEIWINFVARIFK